MKGQGHEVTYTRLSVDVIDSSLLTFKQRLKCTYSVAHIIPRSYLFHCSTLLSLK